MSLDFNLSGVVKFHTPELTHPATRGEPPERQRMHPVTNAVIWNTMFVDIGAITEQNVDEFWYRTRLLQLISGAELRGTDGTEAFLTRQDIRDHVGLRTNVITKTRMQWIKGRFGPDASISNLGESRQQGSARETFDRLYAVSRNEEEAT